MHASYEDRRDAEDPVFASLDDAAFERQVDAWSRELAAAGAAEADVLYLHHLTPINEAAQRVAPDVPVIGHIHGSELLMLERIAAGRAGGLEARGPWAERICDWAAELHPSHRQQPQGPEARERAARPPPRPLRARPERLRPRLRAATRRSPRRIGATTWSMSPSAGHRAPPPAAISYRDDRTSARSRARRCSAVGRFTEVKRLPLLIEAFVAAQPRLSRAHRPRPARRLSRGSGRASTRSRRSSGSAPPTSSSPAGTHIASSPTS